MMTAAEYRDQLAARMTEGQLQTAIEKAAGQLGWLSYHTHDSRRSNPGFPDLVLVRGHRVIFAELKSTKGRVSAHQEQWIRALKVVQVANPDGVQVRVWRPIDWVDDTVINTLQES